MFDKLVESTKTKSSQRGGRIFLLTGLMYAMLLTTLGVWTILGLNPGLAESLDITKLTPPIPLGAALPEQPKPTVAALKNTAVASDIFAPPTKILPPADPSLFERLAPRQPLTLVPGGRPCPNCTGVPDGIPGLKAK